jgi:hypothetical protein
VPIFGTDVSARAITKAARLVGENAVVDALYIIEVPSQLPIDAEMPVEEARARSALESARLAARRAGLPVRTSVLRTRRAGRTRPAAAERPAVLVPTA